MGRNLADGGATPVARHPVAPPPRSVAPPPKPVVSSNWAGAFGQAGSKWRPSKSQAPVYQKTKPSSVKTAAGKALIAGGIGAAQGAALPPPAPVPVESFSGSGRSRGFSSGGGGSGGGGGGGGVSPVTAAATAIAPPPAAVQPPPVVNPAGPGAGNTGGAAFDKVGTGSGTFGQEQRRRQARGPMTGLSVTPEMLRRAATQRIG